MQRLNSSIQVRTSECLSEECGPDRFNVLNPGGLEERLESLGSDGYVGVGENEGCVLFLHHVLDMMI